MLPKNYLCSHRTFRTMKKGGINALRVLAGAALLLAGVYGYVCYEKTRIEGWYPIAFALGGALATMPYLLGRWSRLTGTDDRTLNGLCHLFCVGILCWFGLLGGNYLLADPASEYAERITVEQKLRKTRHRTYRANHRMVRGQSYEVYYLRIAFDDGFRKEMQVPKNVYNRCRENGSATVTMRRGCFGFPVVVRFGSSAAN